MSIGFCVKAHIPSTTKMLNFSRWLAYM